MEVVKCCGVDMCDWHRTCGGQHKWSCKCVLAAEQGALSRALTSSSGGAAAEQSSSAGLLVADQLQLREGGVEVVFGCETKETGEIYNQEADGILGLGNSEVSLVNQVGVPNG